MRSVLHVVVKAQTPLKGSKPLVATARAKLRTNMHSACWIKSCALPLCLRVLEPSGRDILIVAVRRAQIYHRSYVKPPTSRCCVHDAGVCIASAASREDLEDTYCHTNTDNGANKDGVIVWYCYRQKQSHANRI